MYECSTTQNTSLISPIFFGANARGETRKCQTSLREDCLSDIFFFSFKNRHNWYVQMKGIKGDGCIVNRFSSLCSSLLIAWHHMYLWSHSANGIDPCSYSFTGVVCTRFAGASSRGMSVRSFSDLASSDERIVLYGCICTQDGT